MIKISDLSHKFYTLDASIQNSLYFKKEGNQLTAIPFSIFDQLQRQEKEEVLNTLDKAIQLGIPNDKTRHRIQEIRNVIFTGLQDPARESLVNEIPKDIWSKIISFTTPKTVAEVNSVSHNLKRAAIAPLKIRSLNQGLSLHEHLPPQKKGEALEWLKDTKQPHLLEYADLLEFDLDEEDLVELFDVCPNLKFLAIGSKYDVIPYPYLPDLQSLPNLPKELQVLFCQQCDRLQNLPQLPDTLIELSLLECPISTLPKLPQPLKKLVLTYTDNSSLPDLPQSLEELELICVNRLSSLPKLPHSLKKLRIRECDSLADLPSLPPSLEVLECSYCHFITELPELPPNLRELNLESCDNLIKLPKLPIQLKKLNISYCQKLKNVPELPLMLDTFLFDRLENIRYYNIARSTRETAINLQEKLKADLRESDERATVSSSPVGKKRDREEPDPKSEDHSAIKSPPAVRSKNENSSTDVNNSSHNY
ncbi:MAG: hypothetical protein JSS30_04375 [Verrucomicrobia bacterium]|nr:hypothetical protein [Verrucomicrobiota bacterium]